MAITLSGQADDSDGTATVSASAGDLIVVAWAIRNTADFISCVGSLNGTYTQAAAPVSVSGIQCGIHFFQNSAAGTENITISNTAGGTVYVNVSRWAGAHASAALVAGQSTTNAAATTHPHSATGVNATAGQLMLTVAVQSGTITDETVATGFTALSFATALNGRQWWQYRIATGTESSQVAAYTSSSHTSAAMIALFDQAGGGGDPAPTITDVDEDNTITLEQANVEIDGTDFDTATVEIRQGGFVYEPSIDSQSGTAIQFDMATVGSSGPVAAPHAGTADVAVVNGDDQEDTQAITITDRADSDSILVGTPNADPDLRLDGTADVEAGDYVMWFNVQGGAIGDVTVNDDLTFDVDAAVTSFDFQIWDADDGTWGDAATQTIEEVEEDTTPDAYDTFTDQFNVPTTTVRTSNAVTPTGYDTAAAISVSGADTEYDLDSAGSWTNAPGTINPGQTVRLRHTSSGSASTTVTSTVDIGGVTATFESTTAGAGGTGSIAPVAAIIARRRLN